MPQDPQSDQDFLKASPKDQHAYMMATDPDYAKAPATQQSAYLQHLSAPPEPGMLDRADTAITSALAPNPKNYASVADTNLKEVPKTLGREVYSGTKAIAGFPSAMYHAFSDPATEEETEEAGGPEEVSGAKRIGLGIGRMMVKPVMNAVQDYSSGRVTRGGALDVAPEAIGQGAGTVVGAKLAEMASPYLKAGFSKMRESFPLVDQAARTAGKMVANQSIEQPFKAASKVPEYWRQSSPEGRMLAETKRAVAERRASMIPMRVPRAAAGSMIDSVTGAPKVTFVPEPRAPFAGENEGYMASVPRDQLGKMAVTRKPGAGTQLQQLGQPIIYIPNEADFPGPRR